METEPVKPAGGRQRLRDWRFPVRYRLPDRRDLAAYGLMALAFGLMVGIAIGPALATVSGAAQVIAGAQPAPAAAAGAEPPDSPGYELGSPSGSTGSDSAPTADPAPLEPAPTPVSVPAADPASEPRSDPTVYSDGGSDREGGDEPGEEADDGATPLDGTVAGATPSGRIYAVADRAGNLLALHADDAPEVGTRLTVGILPLANGTFLQAAARKERSQAGKVTLRGVVTWIDENAGLAVLSARGASLALDLTALATSVGVEEEAGVGAEGATLPLPEGLAVGSQVEVDVQIGPAAAGPSGDAERARPRMRATSITVDPTEPAPLELNGPIREVDRTARTVRIAADGFGEVDALIEVRLPARLDPRLIRKGGTYSLTAEAAPDGALRATGVRANGSRAEAAKGALLEP